MTLTIAMVAAGRLLRRWGPRRVALMGALLFFGGHLITAWSRGRLVGGYGLTVGAGIGCGYVAALTSGLRWFPHRKGVVTGVAVAGFGLGGLANGLTPEDTTRAIGGLAVGNVAGRLVWGWMYDRIGYRTIPAALVLLCLAIGGMMAAELSPTAFLAAGSLVGFGFGACFVLYAAHVAVTHGVNQVGHLYPFLFLSYGIAGIVGPLLGGLLHDWTGRYSASLALGALVAALGAWLTWRPPA